ncbi:MAG TPA: iron ABC transporter permease [Acidimicrobiales bacterium]|nr:iron ABC transporter permease [Acidimicrobiales bacterium]
MTIGDGVKRDPPSENPLTAPTGQLTDEFARQPAAPPPVVDEVTITGEPPGPSRELGVEVNDWPQRAAQATADQAASGAQRDGLGPGSSPGPRAATPGRLKLARNAGGLARRSGGPALVWAILLVLVAVPVGAFLLQAFMPRLFGQGSSWFTFSNISAALKGSAFRGLFNSLWVSVLTSALDLLIGGGLAWVSMRTNIGGRRLWPALMWGLLLVPTYLMAEGWQYLLEPDGVLYQFHLYSPFMYHRFFSPAGVVFVDALANAPYGFLTMSVALAGLGSQFEEAVRVHGGGRFATFRVVVPVLAPALLASVALVFAETMSDYGVASTLAFQSRFPMATYGIYEAVDDMPARFGVAAILSILLLASAAIPIGVQSRVTRGRSYAILSGRTRQANRYRLRPAAKWASTGLIAAFFLLALGAPALGAFTGSFVDNLGQPIGAHSLSLDAYRDIFSGATATAHNMTLEGTTGLTAPVILSTELAAITATVTAVIGLAVARLLSARRPGRFTKAGDLLLLGSIALPGIVLGAGYIFAFNLPVASRVGLDLYETMPLLVMGYLATSIPTQSRIMMGRVAQVHGSLMEAARVHGARALGAWRSAYVPVVSRVLVLAWLITFTKTFFELPISQLLYPPGRQPVSVAIDAWLSNYDYQIGTATTVIALAANFLVIALVLGAFRLFAPEGWRRMGWQL